MTDKTYHHGNLAAELLQAAERELVLNGIEAFSLRAVAKRAGVSHGAPAYHFKSARGLLTALAATGGRKRGAKFAATADRMRVATSDGTGGANGAVLGPTDRRLR